MSNIVLTLGNSTPYTLLTEWPKTVTSCTANPQTALIFKRRGCWRVYSAKACTTNCGISENEQGHINISIPQYVDTLMGWGGEYRSVGAMENKILTTKMVNGGGSLFVASITIELINYNDETDKNWGIANEIDADHLLLHRQERFDGNTDN